MSTKESQETQNATIAEDLASQGSVDAQVAESQTLKEATGIMNKYILWSMGAGFIPIPLIDTAAVTGVQLKMLNDMSKAYGIEFKANRVKSIVAALVGGLSADMVSRSMFNSWLKTVPFIGIVGQLSMPAYSGATTYAVGKVFIQHFESGGTFLDFNPDKVKNYFSNLYTQGKNVAASLAGAKAS
ncbi:MAG: YcjF family protein [Chloroflexota bacterium]